MLQAQQIGESFYKLMDKYTYKHIMSIKDVNRTKQAHTYTSLHVHMDIYTV